MTFDWLKRYMPRGIYGRAALILILPVVTLQLVVSVVFIQRLFEDVTSQMTKGAALEIAEIVARIEAAPDRAAAREILFRLADALEIEAACGFSGTAGDAAWRFGVRQITLALGGVGEAVMARGLATGSEAGQAWIAGRAALIHASATAASADMAARQVATSPPAFSA